MRLLTLTGAGGSGKTRLALQARGGGGRVPAGRLVGSAREVREPATCCGRGARRSAAAGRSPADRRPRLLLLLDNFEHVVDAAAEVAALLAACPRLDVVVTSRERLRIAGEHVYPVPVLARGEARRLFVARARAAVPEFEPDEHVDELCARLDDLPLAIELAAACTSLLTAEQLLERLGKRLDLLRGGRDAEPASARCVRRSSGRYELLNAEEQQLFAALSIFRGGWTLEARSESARPTSRRSSRWSTRASSGARVGSPVHARDDPRVRSRAARPGAAR